MAPPDHQRTLISISLDLIKDPMFALLLAGGRALCDSGSLA